MRIAAKPLPDLEVLKSTLVLDAASGALFWRDRAPEMFQCRQSYLAWHTNFAGKRADHLAGNGYMRVRLRISGKQEIYSAHRIIWKMVAGHDPAEEIDHIDQNRTNNAISNLREATRLQNTLNRTIYTKSVSRRQYPAGVYPRRGKFLAQVTVDGRTHYLGMFDTPEAARAVLQEYRSQFGIDQRQLDEFERGNAAYAASFAA